MPSNKQIRGPDNTLRPLPDQPYPLDTLDEVEVKDNTKEEKAEKE